MIDTSGQWWVGDSPSDLEEYLKVFKAEGYEVDLFRLSRCKCGSEVFRLVVDDDEGAAKRTCASCGNVQFIGDSEIYFLGEGTRAYKCVDCHTDTSNVGVGFSLYDSGSHDVRWRSVGVRCPKCGILGCMIDWKVGGGHAPEFLEKV